MTDYSDVGEFVTKLTALNPENLVWGTDWPHPKFNGPMPDDTDMLDQFMDWVPNAQLRHKILVENPERFYQFPPLEGVHNDGHIESALKVLDEHISALNARDPSAIAATLHFPHFRLWNGPERMADT